ncbi:MAG: RDD family protein [Pseudomonadales bacterium]|nr:RDD family protein [Pseudomonadales bacterium]NRA17382.1 RDD family protein [Oceanospirillaceae bacterium]
MTRTFDQNNASHASLMRRLGAIGYDSLVVIALAFAVTALWLWLMNTDKAVGPAFQSTLFISIFTFFGFFWTRSGQTIGMMAWRVRVQSKEGNSISWTQALIRFFVAILSTGCLGAGYLWMLFNDEKLTWQDMLSNSEIVYLPKDKT